MEVEHIGRLTSGICAGRSILSDEKKRSIAALLFTLRDIRKSNALVCE
jgi:hypothetical protein